MHRKKLTVLPVLREFWRGTKRYRLLLFGTVFFMALAAVFEILIPLFYKRLFDVLAASPMPSEESGRALIATLAGIALFQFFAWCARRVSLFSNLLLQPKVMNELSQNAFAYLLGHSYSFFINNFAGSLVRKVNRLSRAFEQFADRVAFDFIPLFVSLIGIVIVLFMRHFALGTTFLIWALLVMGLQLFIARLKFRYSLLVAEKDSESTGVLSDAVSNAATIKLFDGSTHEKSIFSRVANELERLRIRSWRFDEYVNLVQGALMIAIEILLLYVTILLWQRGIVTVGDFALVQAYLVTAILRIWGFGNVVRRMYEAFADGTEMVDILNRPHEITDTSRAKPLAVSSGKIEFRNVDFRFHKTRGVLKDFSLAVAGREKVALVGPSGSGKSTVARLLFRFHEVTEGGIYIDDQNIAGVTQSSLRDAIAFVPQEPVLFHRTLMENIRYGRRDATDEEVIEAAKKAHCYEFIGQLPEGFETYVGERGVKLSGGERQRVAIARAILKDAPILVLDEATSSLDSESEALIQDALGLLMEDKTVVVIAHRLSTIMKMDRIIVMENGRVVTTGTHSELLTHEGGLYKKLWEIQAGGFLAE